MHRRFNGEYSIQHLAERIDPEAGDVVFMNKSC